MKHYPPTWSHIAPQRSLRFVLLLMTALVLSLALTEAPARAAGPVSFTASALNGENVNKPTSLQFGPDGRLYVAQQDGTIFAYRIVRNAANNYTVTQTETINLVKAIPNHNDDGTVNAGVNTRQVTGLLVTGTAANPVLYVSSSDPRRGLNNDTNLDTNSGIVSRLTWNGAQWVKLDLVRGLPRSEEYHSVNGLQLNAATNTLFLAVGGHANMGAPSGTLSWLSEYALSAAILAIDLNAIGNTTYDLPTIDDPTRGTPGQPDPGDPFGGNDGRNQARVVPGGPVRLYSTGYRNPYDVVITQAGRMYTIDNGSNANWGGPPEGEGTANCINKTVEAGAMTTPDNLHLVTDGFYAGNAAPTRGNPAGAGLWDYNVNTGEHTLIMTFTTNNTPVPFNMANPVECDYRQPLVDDGALYGWGYSTNGLTEYTASNFGGNMKGDLLAAGYNGSIQRVELNAGGTATTNVSAVFANFGSTPLDVTAQGDTQVFPGTVWVATFGANNINVFEPTDYNGGSGLPCTRADNPNLDEDNDGFDNADELDNGTDPCNAGSVPEDNDDDGTSNLVDNDDDNDGILDPVDKFAIDPNNGTTTNLPIAYSWNAGNPGFGLLDLGFTGLMVNNTADYLTLYDTLNMTWGGAAGKITIDAIPAGSAASNNQAYGFQFGVNTTAATQPFTVRTAIDGPFFNGGAASGQQSMGLYIGNGDQDNYLRMVIGAGGVTVAGENGGNAYSNTYPANLAGAQEIQLFLSVNPATATVQPKYIINNGAMTPAGTPVVIPAGSQLYTAITGAPAMAVGVIATSAGGAPFTATWDYIDLSFDAPATLSATPDPLDFTTVQTGQNATRTVTLSNQGLPGDPAIQVTALNLPAGVFTLVNPPTTPFTLNPGQTVDLTVRFAPTAVGNANANLTINHSGANSPYVVELAGQGFAPIQALYRVNAGGPQVAATDGGIAWGRDQDGANRSPFVNTGNVYTPGAFNGTNNTGAPNAVFSDERWDAPAAPEMMWAFPINTPGQYEVRLYFAETCTCIAGVGGRVFDVSVEGQVVLDNYDVFARAGNRDIAVREVYIATVTDGTLNIEFLHVTENPSVKALEILPFSNVVPTANLTISPSPVAFGNATVGGAAVSQQVTLTNNGAAGAPNITVTGITIGGGSDANQFNTAALAQPVVLAPGQTRNITVNFAPTSSGLKTATLQVAHNGSNAPQATAQLNGTGVGGTTAALTIAPATVNYAQTLVGQTTPQQITLTHSGAAGTANITITALTLGGANANQFNMTALAQPIVLTPGQQHIVTVNFAPTTPGAKVGQLQIAHNGSNAVGGSSNVALNGEGVNPTPVALTLPTGPINFGQATVNGAPIPQQITLRNNGGAGSASITITAITIGGADGGQFNTVALAQPIILAPGQTHQFTVNFAPTTAGVKNAQIQIAHNGTNGPNSNLAITGEGIAAAQPTGTVVYRINAGGPTAAATDGGMAWAQDLNTAAGASPRSNFAATNNQTYQVAAGQAIDMTHPSLVGMGAPAALFRSERYDLLASAAEMEWDFPVVVGNTYIVRLYFAEIYPQAAAVRQMDVTVEGTLWLDNYRPFVAAGNLNYRGVMEARTIVAADNNIDINFLHVPNQDNPTIKGLEIVQVNNNPAAAALNITPNPVNFANTNTGATTPQQITLTHTGAAGSPNITITGITIGGADAGQFNTPALAANVVLTPGQTYQFNVNFAPTTAGAKVGQLQIAHNGSNGPNSNIPLNGTGVAATAALNGAPNPVAFGTVAVNSNTPQQVTLTHSGAAGTAPITITAITIGGADAGQFNTPALAANIVLQPGQTHQFNVNFAPTTAGVKAGQLQIAHNGSNAPTLNIPLTGTAQATAALNSSANPINFANTNVNATTPQQITLTHSGAAGTAPITITAITIGGAQANQFNTPALAQPIVLQPGQTHQFTVNFAPTTAGAKVGQLQIAHNGTNGPQFNIALNGTGVAVAAAALNIAPNPVNFGNVNNGQTGTQQVTLTHSGAAGSPNITVTTITIGGANAGMFATPALAQPLVLTPGQTQQINVTFTPGFGGAKVGQLQIAHNGSNGPNTNIPLNGAGVTPTGMISTIRINSGGPLVAATDAPNPAWSEDSLAVPSQYGNVAANQGNVSAPYAGAVNRTDPSMAAMGYVPGAIFATQRFDMAGAPTLDYNFPAVVGQTYVVRLFFMESFHNAANLRTFNVRLENTTVLTNFDIYVAAGNVRYKAVMREFTITATDNNIDLDFLHGTVDNPAVRGIEILTTQQPTAALNAAPNPVAFGNVNTGANNVQQITLTHSGAAGTAPITITAITLGGADAAQFNTPALAQNVVLQPGQTYQFNVTFAPTTAGAKTAQVNIAHNGSNGPQLNVPLTGTGILPTAALTIAPNPVAFGNVNTGANNVQQVTLTHSGAAGTAPITITAITVGGADATLFTTPALAQNVVLQPGQNYQFNVTFAPTTAGAKTAQVDIAHNGSNGPASNLPLTGAGVVPTAALTITPNPLNFGNAGVNTPSALPVTLTHSGAAGTADITITAITVAGANAAQFMVVPLAQPIVLQAGQNQIINVTFTPAVVGNATADLQLAHNGSNGPQSVVPMNGAGVALGTAALNIAPNPVNFGNVQANGGTNAQQVTLTHTGGTGTPNITVTAIVIGGANGNQFATPALAQPFVLTPGQTEIVNVTFAPTAVGAQVGQLQITHDGSNGPQSNVVLNGVGVDPNVAVLSINPNPTNFGQLVINSTPVTRTIMLTNSGGPGAPAINITGVTLVNDPNSISDEQFRFDPFTPVQLIGGQTAMLSVDFAPNTAGVHVATLEVAHDNGTNTPTVTPITLNGEGIYGQGQVTSGLQVNPSALNFGSFTLPAEGISEANALPPQTVTLTYVGNTGDPALTVSGVALAGANPESFTHNFTAPFTLNVGDSAVLGVAFIATTPGDKTATLQIAHSGANGPVTNIALSGTALGNGSVGQPSQPGQPAPAAPVAAPASVTISKSANPPFALPGDNVSWSIVVTNTAATPASNVTVTDNVPAELEIIGASSSGGTASASGQSVSVTIPQLAPGQSVTVTVETRIRASVSIPFAIRNEACAGTQCGGAQVISVTALPRTGESPWSKFRLPVFALGGVSLSLALFWIGRRVVNR
ncbi:MAG: choice-of-anchor D domain-containing protein [bacterium]|nr:choice-of-anchor D domain-containing protein [bacterium]